MKLVVLGGGPAGYVAALRAAQLGAQSVLVEAREVGGTCLNRGCIPTKSMVASVERLRGARDAADFGVEVGTPGVDFAALMRRKDEVVAHERAGVEHLLKARKVEVVAGHGRLVGPRRVRVEPIAGGGDGGPGEPLEIEGDALVLLVGPPECAAVILAVPTDRVENIAAVGLQAVTQAIVQPAGAALPEFEQGGQQAVTAPVRRHGNVAVGVLPVEFLEALLQ